MNSVGTISVSNPNKERLVRSTEPFCVLELSKGQKNQHLYGVGGVGEWFDLKIILHKQIATQYTKKRTRQWVGLGGEGEGIGGGGKETQRYINTK